MNKIFIIICVVLALCSSCFAATGEDIAISTVAVSQFQSGLINNASGPATQAECSVTGNPVNWRVDGRAPSSTSGNPFTPASNTLLVINGNDLLNSFKAIATGGAAVLHCTYLP